MVCKWLGNTAGACLTATPAFLCSSRVKWSKRHVLYCIVLCDQVTSDRVSHKRSESIAPVGADAEIALVRHSQFRNNVLIVCLQGIVCVSLCTFIFQAEPVSRDQILRRERGRGNTHLRCSADHVQDWQPYTVHPYSCYVCDHTYNLNISPPDWGMLRRSRCVSSDFSYKNHRIVKLISNRASCCWKYKTHTQTHAHMNT